MYNRVKVGGSESGKFRPTAGSQIRSPEVPLMPELTVIRSDVRALVSKPFPVGQLARLSPGIGAGWPAPSDDTLWFLTPTLGPLSTLALHRLSSSAILGVYEWNVEDLATALGVMRGKAIDSLVRLAMFGFADVANGEFQVATWVPPLPHQWRRRLPSHLISFYDERIKAA
jgi:hypothetical protein